MVSGAEVMFRVREGVEMGGESVNSEALAPFSVWLAMAKLCMFAPGRQSCA